MLPIVLVLFVATGAFAAPSVSITQFPIQEVSRPYDTGAGFNRGLAAQLLELVDGGDANIYTLTLEQSVQDLANNPDSYSQALAASQTIAILGEIGKGVAGNACSAANAINQYASSGAGQSFLSTLASNIDTIAALAANPSSVRYSSSGTGNCGNARSYQFEAAWDGILRAASPYTIGLVNEEYCASKRLYNSYQQRSNNVAAVTTAASLPTVVQVVERHLGPIMNFLRAAANGNGYAYAAAAKKALLS